MQHLIAAVVHIADQIQHIFDCTSLGQWLNICINMFNTLSYTELFVKHYSLKINLGMMWMWHFLKGNHRSVLAWTNMTPKHKLLYKLHDLVLMTEGEISDSRISWLLLLRTIGDAFVDLPSTEEIMLHLVGIYYLCFCCLGNLSTNSPSGWVRSTFVTSEVKVQQDHQISLWFHSARLLQQWALHEPRLWQNVSSCHLSF